MRDMSTYWGILGYIGLYWGCIGKFWGYIQIMENKMETAKIMQSRDLVSVVIIEHIEVAEEAVQAGHGSISPSML